MPLDTLEILETELRYSATESLTIQEMAKQSGLSEHTLRYYERIGLLSPIPRDGSSGHRRYSAETVALVESLSCLRGTGMPIEEMRCFLELRKQGHAAASEQKALFAAHQKSVERELDMIKVRLEYLKGKVAFWEAVEAGDVDRIKQIAEANRLVGKRLAEKREIL